MHLQKNCNIIMIASSGSLIGLQLAVPHKIPYPIGRHQFKGFIELSLRGVPDQVVELPESPTQWLGIHSYQRQDSSANTCAPYSKSRAYTFNTFVVFQFGFNVQREISIYCLSDLFPLSFRHFSNRIYLNLYLELWFLVANHVHWQMFWNWVLWFNGGFQFIVSLIYSLFQGFPLSFCRFSNRIYLNFL